MAESTLEPPSSFEHGTPGLGIQRLNHYATVPIEDDRKTMKSTQMENTCSGNGVKKKTDENYIFDD